MTTSPKTYEVTTARRIGGRWCNPGERIDLTPRAAKYYLPPLGSGLVEVSAEDPAPAVVADVEAAHDTAPAEEDGQPVDEAPAANAKVRGRGKA